MAIVYLATNRVNGKRYVGVSSKPLNWRRGQHEYDALKGPAGCRLFHRAIKKYGPEAFEWSVIFSASSYEDALSAEVRLIAELRPEYNLTTGGTGCPGLVHTPEMRARNAAAQKGKKLSAEHRRNISEGVKRRAPVPDLGAKISAAKKGIRFSAEHRKALSEAAKRRWENGIGISNSRKNREAANGVSVAY